jgi:hypothetical protein
VDDEQDRDPPNPLAIAHDLVELAAVHGRMARVLRRLSDNVPIAGKVGASELDWLLTEARTLDERTRVIWETKLEPFLVAHARQFEKGKPPWPL